MCLVDEAQQCGQIFEPNEHLDGGLSRRALERCQCFIREGMAGIALRAEVQEITRTHREVFTVDSACEADTQPETEMEFGQY